MKRIVVFLGIAMCLCFLAGCTLNNNGTTALMKRNVTVSLGKEYSALWFDFTILSIAEISEYAGYSARDGYKLIDVVITETSTFNDIIPMGIYDFYIDCEAYYNYEYPLEPFDNTMMPEEFYLSYGETVEYHMIFEIPLDTYDPLLMYTEFNEDNEEGTTYILNF